MNPIKLDFLIFVRSDQRGRVVRILVLPARRNPFLLDFPMLFWCWFDVGSVLLWCCFLVESLLFPCWQNVVLLLVLPSKWHFCRMARYAFVVQTHLVRETLRPLMKTSLEYASAISFAAGAALERRRQIVTKKRKIHFNWIFLLTFDSVFLLSRHSTTY